MKRQKILRIMDKLDRSSGLQELLRQYQETILYPPVSSLTPSGAIKLRQDQKRLEDQIREIKQQNFDAACQACNAPGLIDRISFVYNLRDPDENYLA